jgi:hypothetical protein
MYHREVCMESFYPDRGSGTVSLCPDFFMQKAGNARRMLLAYHNSSCIETV